MSNKIGNIRVPNEIPEGPLDILCVGEAPGADEELEGRPFVGRSGQLLRETLMNFGAKRVGYANLSQFRPEYNRFEHLVNSNELAQGQIELNRILQKHPINLVIGLGNEPFCYLSDKVPEETKISKWRGSLIQGEYNKKVLASYHPSYMLRNSDKLVMFMADMQRAVEQSKTPELPRLIRNFYIAGQCDEWHSIYEEMLHAPALAVDIESVKQTKANVGKKPIILCVGFADSSDRALCFPNDPYFRPFILELLACAAKKIFHNGLYDTEVFRLNGIEATNYSEDTIVQHFALEPELPRSLDFLASIYTYQPYYKSVGRGEIPDDTKVWSEKVDKSKLYVYNCTDCVVTYEIWYKLSGNLANDPLCYRVYRNRMEQQRLSLSIGRNGMLVDPVINAKLAKALTWKWQNLQFALNMIAQATVNVNSPIDVPKFLYEYLKLPVRRDGKGSITTDEDAIVSLIGFVQNKIDELKTDKVKLEWTNKREALRLILEIRGIRKALSSYIKTKLSEDGRARSTVKVATTETGRWAAAKFVDGTGLNNMTLPRDGFECGENIPDTFSPEKLLAIIERETNTDDAFD